MPSPHSRSSRRQTVAFTIRTPPPSARHSDLRLYRKPCFQRRVVRDLPSIRYIVLMCSPTTMRVNLVKVTLAKTLRVLPYGLRARDGDRRIHNHRPSSIVKLARLNQLLANTLQKLTRGFPELARNTTVVRIHLTRATMPNVNGAMQADATVVQRRASPRFPVHVRRHVLGTNLDVPAWLLIPSGPLIRRATVDTFDPDHESCHSTDPHSIVGAKQRTFETDASLFALRARPYTARSLSRITFSRRFNRDAR